MGRQEEKQMERKYKPTIVVQADDKSRQYGEDNPSFTFTVTPHHDLKVRCTCEATPASPPASYDILPELASPYEDLLEKYDVDLKVGNLLVDRAPLTITAQDAIRLYGAPNPPFSATVSQNADGITASAACAADPSSPVGTYPIVPTLVDPNNMGSNYDVRPNKAKLTVGKLQISGLVTFGAEPIAGVKTAAIGLPRRAESSKGFRAETITQSDGTYSIPVDEPGQFRVEFPQSHSLSDGREVYLKGPHTIYCQAIPGKGASLPDVQYELRGCRISGVVERKIAAESDPEPFPGVGVDLIDPAIGAIQEHVVTDAQGGFCFFTEPSGEDLMTLRFDREVTVANDTYIPPEETIDVKVDPEYPFPLSTPVVYRVALAEVLGQVTDGQRGIKGVEVELYDHATQKMRPGEKTNGNGIYAFKGVRPGAVDLVFPNPAKDSGGGTWELQEGQTGKQSFVLKSGEIRQVLTVAYQLEQHIIEKQVTIAGQPAVGILVDVRLPKATTAIESARTNEKGLAVFKLAQAGKYEVRVYPDPLAFGDTLVEVHEVHSKTSSTTNLPSTPAAASTAPAKGAAEAAIDLQAYPVLTEEVPSGGASRSTKSARGGVGPLGQTAENAIREVLSWRTKSDDPKSFVMALNQSFALDDIEGHTEFTWTPRSYTVQTDLGAVTGAQASIYTRAKVALDQSLPLLDGLYPLLPEVLPEDLESIRVVVRSQFTELVSEFGVEGGPRVPRADQLLLLLLGDNVSPPGLGAPTGPEDLDRGSLFNLRNRFGLKRNFINTIDDEQNFTNYLILVDYVLGLNQSWNSQKQFFTRNGIPGAEPFFGTQLVLLSRALDVVAQSVQDAYFTLDSVFLSAAERQTTSLDFSGATVAVPVKGIQQSFTFPAGTSSLFVAELLDWVDRTSSDELPRLLQDAGKDGLPSLTSIVDNLRKFVRAALLKSLGGAQDSPSLPPGYRTPRVQRALQELADQLDETYRLASQINPPRFSTLDNLGTGNKRADRC